MIVRDEQETIERCLESVRPLINSWVICDTGSKDSTPWKVESALDGIPGELHHTEWRDFGVNRTEVVRRARGAAEFLLLVDADMVVSFDRERLVGLGADAYVLRETGPPAHAIPRLLRGDREWSFIGATRERLAAPGPLIFGQLDAISLEHLSDED